MSFQFLPSVNVRGIFLRVSKQLTSSLGWSLLFIGQWVGGCSGFVPYNLFIQPKHRFPVLIRRTGLQEARIRAKFAEKKVACLPWVSHVECLLFLLKQLLAFPNEFSVANNSKCFTKRIACRCGYDNLQSRT